MKMDRHIIQPIARIENDFSGKFGIPRQAGIVEELESRVVFLPEFRREEALRGIEGFSHIWLIWGFSENLRDEWQATVRPPRLGGNRRLGVFATRSPFRPNALGLSCLRLLRLERDEKRGLCLVVSGADLMNGSPIFDIKPYLPYADCRPEASSGFAPDPGARLEVEFSPRALELIPPEKLPALRAILENDPRPRYQSPSHRPYAFEFAGLHIEFRSTPGGLLVDSVEKL